LAYLIITYRLITFAVAVLSPNPSLLKRGIKRILSQSLTLAKSYSGLLSCIAGFINNAGSDLIMQRKLLIDLVSQLIVLRTILAIARTKLYVVGSHLTL